MSGPLSANEAIDLLHKAPDAYTTPDQLRMLAARVNADATGRLTVLYSGGVGKGVWSTDVIKGMTAAGEDVRVINNSQAATFMESKEFYSAVAKAYDISPRLLRDDSYRGPAKDWLYHPTQGPWADASARFAEVTKGEVRAIVPGADPTRTFGAVELPRVIANPQVTTIEGMPRQTLVKVVAEQGLQPAFEMTVAKAHEHVATLRVAVNASGMPLKENGALQLDSRGYTAGTSIQGKTPTHTIASREMADLMGPANPTARAGQAHLQTWQTQLARDAGVEALHPSRNLGQTLRQVGTADAAIGTTSGFRTLAKVSGAAGTGLMVYDAVTTARQYNALTAQGNQFGADALLHDYVGRTAGGVVGGAAAGAAYGVATGSWSGPGALATGLVGGVAGAVGGDYIAKRYTEYQVNHQTGSDGQRYTHTAGQGWSHGNTPAPAAQTETLEYKRSSAVTSLALANPQVLDSKNITVPDAQGKPTAWHGDGKGHWSAQVANPAYAPQSPLPALKTLAADAGTAAQLNQIAAARQQANDQYPQAVAKAFAIDHYGRGWDKAQPLPEHITKALKLPSEQHIADPATGQVWDATAKGFERTERSYAPDKYTDSVVAHDVTVQASAQETARLQQAHQQVREGNARYGAQAIAQTYEAAQQQQPAQQSAPHRQSQGAPASSSSSTSSAVPASAQQSHVRDARAEHATTQFSPERPPHVPTPHRPNITPASIPTPGGLGGAGGTNSHDAPKHREDERKEHAQQDAARPAQQAPSNAEQALALAQLHEMASTSQRKDEQAERAHTPEAPQPAPSSLSFYQREAQQRRDAPEKTSPTPPPLEPAGGYAQPAHPLSAQPNEFGKRYALEQRDRISPEQVAQHAQEQAQMLRGPQTQQRQAQQPQMQSAHAPQTTHAPSLEAKTARSARPAGASSYQNHSSEALQPTQTAQATPTQRGPGQPSQQAQQDDKRIDEPGHPGHEMFKQARTGLLEQNAKLGIVVSDERLNNMSANLAASAALAGLTQIDHVRFSTDGNRVSAAQGELRTAGLQKTGMPVERSYQQAVYALIPPTGLPCSATVPRFAPPLCRCARQPRRRDRLSALVEREKATACKSMPYQIARTVPPAPVWRAREAIKFMAITASSSPSRSLHTSKPDR